MRWTIDLMKMASMCFLALTVHGTFAASPARGATTCELLFKTSATDSRDVSPYYRYARIFAETRARELAALVFDYAIKHPDKKINVIVALGGAEHLGNLVRLMLLEMGIHNVNVIDMFLTSRILSHWHGELAVDGRTFEVAGTLPPTDPRIRVALGEFGLTEGRRYLEEGIRALDFYFKRKRAFDADHVVVLDTGVGGSVVDSVVEFAQRAGSQATIEGVLVYHKGSARRLNRAPIRSLNNGSRDGNFGGDSDNPTLIELSPRWWASMLDNEGMLSQRMPFEQAFQRSWHGHKNEYDSRDGVVDGDVRYYRSPTYIRLVSSFGGLNKRLEIGAFPFTSAEALQNHKETLDGLRAGVRALQKDWRSERDLNPR